MRNTSQRLALVLFLIGLLFSVGQAQETATTEEAKATTEESKSESNEPTQEELFAKFKDSLQNSVMVGTFTIDGDKEKKQREESYEIRRVVKAEKGDFWNIFARMKYGKVDVTLPFPVEVKWAGNTPVITCDELKLVGMGVFDARIVISDNKYAGTWRHGEVGGLMFGRIEKKKDEKEKANDTADADEE